MTGLGRGLGCSLLLALAACGQPAVPEPAVATPPAPSASHVAKESSMDKAVRQGALVIYKAGHKIGEERYRDDGAALVSDLSLAGQKGTVTITRATRHVRVEAGGHTIDRDLPAGVLGLENGSFQAYALAAESFQGTVDNQPVRVMVPAQGVTLDGQLSISPREGGGRRIKLTMAGLEVLVDVDASGAVERGSVPLQGLEAVREGTEPTRVEARAAPANVTSEPLEVEHAGVALRGELWLPKNAAAKTPVVLFVAGSGPTDRDGNSSLGLRSDCYRMLAEALADRGVATVRFDKRGVGKSGVTFDVPKVTIDDFVGDATAIAATLRRDARFGHLAVLGHSEGGLIALMMATAPKDKAVPIDSVVLVSAPGRPLGAIIHEQIASKVEPAVLAKLDKALGDLRARRAIDDLPPEIAPLFAPVVHDFMRSVIDMDPAPLAAKVKTKLTIIQGEHDAQVKPEDAKLLAKASHGATLKLFASMNHVLKDEPSSALPQASYQDPSRPLSAGLADAVASAVR